MSYWDIATMSRDADLISREQACAAQELPPTESPWAWVNDRVLHLAASPGWADAWASALASGNQNPGRDPAVITDGQILSAVQALIGAA